MSEIIGNTASVLEQAQSDLSDSYIEVADEEWGTELRILVETNENVLVRCSWMNDSAVTLGEAMTTYAYPPHLTAEDEPFLISVVMGLLANQVTETEEHSEEDKQEKEESVKTDEADQKSDTRAEDEKAQENSNTVYAEGQPKKETDTATRLELSDSRIKKTDDETRSTTTAEAQVRTNHVSGESVRSDQGADKAEAVASPSNITADRTRRISTGAPEAPAVISNTPGSSARGSISDRTSKEFTVAPPLAGDKLNEMKSAAKLKFEAKQQIPTLEIPVASTVANPIVKVKSVLDRPQLAIDQETGPLALTATIEVSAETEPTELSVLYLENQAIPEETAERSDEKFEVAEDESTLTILDYRMDDNSLTDFAEEEVLLIDHLEDAGLGPDELCEFYSIPISEVVNSDLETEEASISQLSNVANISRQMGIINPEELAQISLTIEKIEGTLIQATENISDSEPDTTQELNEILDKIIEVPGKLKDHTGENIITEVEAQEELEELFTKLLDKIDIDYTPELIESLARLTLKWHLADEVQNLKDKEETDKTPQASGTHEFIKKLLVGLSIIKKAMAHVSAIGKSALRLYNFNLAT